ncbi:VOC family protein [Ferruginibacter sp. SUN002]|uniref:VOC family protein n=1 Tax=Ferruginibacter sp. SUN002 TaxID=2937789 RepID=UPI003D35A388
MADQIYPCIWFDGQAKAAAEFYGSIFPNSKITTENPIVVLFELNGFKFMGLNGGPQFTPNEAVSFVVNCEDQAEIDHYWYKLIADGGEESMCGWLKDKYGVSWQIVPKTLGKLMSDPEKGQRVMNAFLKMRKFDIQALLDA